MPEAIEIQLKKGALELCVLALLHSKDNYAYEIASRLAEGIDMGEGTIYPLLHRLEKAGLVEAQWRLDDGGARPRKRVRPDRRRSSGRRRTRSAPCCSFPSTRTTPWSAPPG